MREGDDWKTTFKTKFGLYELLIMLFGLTNTPSPFMRLMNLVLGSLIQRCVVVYFDDILVYSTCVDDHVKHVRQVLKLLKDEYMYVNLEKCTFYTQKVIFLGFMDRLSNTLTLVVLNFHKSFKLECDASNLSIGAILLQERHPITFVWQHYLLSNKFVVHSDHGLLKYLKGQHKLNRRRTKWANVVVDALFKRHALLAMLETKLLGFECIKDLYVNNDDFKEAYDSCAILANGGFFKHEGFLFKEKRLCVPKSSIKELSVSEAHKGGLMGHFCV
ncbi:Tf2-9, partial [Mucuna pruriens]